jgi:hypothetical protein
MLERRSGRHCLPVGNTGKPIDPLRSFPSDHVSIGIAIQESALQDFLALGGDRERSPLFGHQLPVGPQMGVGDSLRAGERVVGFRQAFRSAHHWATMRSAAHRAKWRLPKD